jgi:hypothetical protein
MRETKFQTFLQAAEFLGGDYSKGYKLGLSAYYYGESFELPTSVELLSVREGDYGSGFREGYAGQPPKEFLDAILTLNAKGELIADSHLHMNLNAQIKSQYVRKAKNKGLKLDHWIMNVLDREVKK